MAKINLVRTTRKLIPGKPVNFALRITGDDVMTCSVKLNFERDVLTHSTIKMLNGFYNLHNPNFDWDGFPVFKIDIYKHDIEAGMNMKNRTIATLVFIYEGGNTEVQIFDPILDDHLGNHIRPLTTKNAHI